MEGQPCCIMDLALLWKYFIKTIFPVLKGFNFRCEPAMYLRLIRKSPSWIFLNTCELRNNKDHRVLDWFTIRFLSDMDRRGVVLMEEYLNKRESKNLAPSTGSGPFLCPFYGVWVAEEGT